VSDASGSVATKAPMLLPIALFSKTSKLLVTAVGRSFTLDTATVCVVVIEVNPSLSEHCTRKA
jgi:hypothetical protein